MEQVIAVVVTRDRRDLLRDCLRALESQERPVDGVLVVDNASSDGTDAMVRDEFGWADILRLPDNVGGAGGFRAGMIEASRRRPDWIWLLDDDAIAQPQCLARLLEAADRPGLRHPVLLASRVEWTDGTLHPMNRPILRIDDPSLMIACAEQGLAPLRTATFASLLVGHAAVARHGLPISGYFVWADDIEYTARVLRSEVGYYVPASIVEHRTRAPHSPVAGAGERFYYHVRNNLYMLRGSAWRFWEKPGLGWHLLLSVLDYLRSNRFKWSSIRVVLRGVRDGLGPVPNS